MSAVCLGNISELLWSSFNYFLAASHLAQNMLKVHSVVVNERQIASLLRQRIWQNVEQMILINLGLNVMIAGQIFAKASLS